MPARDEADTVETTIAALATQRSGGGSVLDPARFEVLLLANNCRDATAEIARRAGARFPGFQLHVVEIDFSEAEAHVGNARRLLMETAAARLLDGLGRRDGVIATTDADTIVASDWIAATLGEIRGEEGRHPVQAVGGRVRPCRRGLSALGPEAVSLQRRDALYWQLATAYVHALDPDPHDPWPRHYHHFGGSLAVTAGAYRAVGGLPALRALEDLAFYEALVRHDIPFRHSWRVRVTTSARCHGRTPVGLSATMKRWTEAAAQRTTPEVESPAALATRTRLRRDLRAFWSSARNRARPADHPVARPLTGPLDESFGDVTELAPDAAAAAPHFGAWYESMIGPGGAFAVKNSPETVTIDDAIADLRARLAALRRTRAADIGISDGEPVAA